MTSPVRAVSVFGLGKLGLTLASCIADSKQHTVGFDPDKALVGSINAGTAQSVEPGVLDRLHRGQASGHFTATDSAEQATAETDISFIVVPTPSNVLGGFSNIFVLEACRAIGAACRAKQTDHTIVVVSTMLPGSSIHSIIPAIEEGAGRALGDRLGYCYSPSFIALGEVVKGIETPDYLLVGEADSDAGNAVLDVMNQVVRNNAPVARMSPTEAEIAKIASNTHETMRVSFANMLFSLCSEIPGVDVDRVTEALTFRMGKRFFKGATPYGGPCWPRDNRALSAVMAAIGVPNRLPHTIDLVNADHGQYILRRILGMTRPGQAVGVLGLAYKPGTPVSDHAFGIDLARWLAGERRRVVAWDPSLSMEAAREALGPSIEIAGTAEECLGESELAVLTIPLAEFARVKWASAAKATIVDCWRCLPQAAIAAVGQYCALGRGPDTDIDEWLAGEIGQRIGLLTN